MLKKIRDKLYVWVLQKDRLKIQEESIKKGYEYGKNDATESFNLQKYNYNRLADEWFVSATDFLEVDKLGQLSLGGEDMSANEILSIQEEIKYIERSRIWHIFQETLKQKAIEKAMMNSTKWEEVLAGKMMIHSLGVFKSILAIIKNHKATK